MRKYRFRKISGAAGSWLRYACLTAAVLAAAAAGAGKGTSPEPQDIRIVQEIPAEELPEMPAETAEQNSDAEIPDIYVYVCGQVLSPGVYRLKGGSRVYEAVEAAGGLTGDAAPESVDMAAVLQDARTVYIPSGEEAAAGMTAVRNGMIGAGSTGAAGSGQDSRVDINTADASELASLPGIGERRAAAVIEYREKNGRFTDIRQLMQISGIGEAVYAGLKDLVRVGE